MKALDIRTAVKTEGQVSNDIVPNFYGGDDVFPKGSRNIFEWLGNV